MTRPFRFALQAMNLADREVIIETATQAEALGYEELYSYDHFGAVDPFVPLVIAAEATTSLHVGPLVLNNEFHHPALLARTAATVDRLTGGRLVLGMGTGYAQKEHDAMGLELRPPGPRVDRLTESLAALRVLLDTGAHRAEGEHHQLAIDDMGVRPQRDRVPILLGGHGRRVVELGGIYADIFQFTGLTHADDGTPLPGGFAIDQVQQRAGWLSEAAGDRGDQIERSVLVQATAIGDGAEAAIDEATTRLGVEREIVEQTPFLLMGTVEQVVDKVGRLREQLGVSHFVVRDAAGFAPVVAALRGR